MGFDNIIMDWSWLKILFTIILAYNIAKQMYIFM